MKRIVYFILILFLATNIVSCHGSYHSTKRKKGEACDCPKNTRVKQPAKHHKR